MDAPTAGGERTPCQIQILTIWPSFSGGHYVHRILPNPGSVAKHEPRGAWPNLQVMSGPAIIIFIARANSPIHRLNAAAFCNCFLPSLLALSLPLRPPARTAAFYSTFFISLAGGHRLCWQRGLVCIFSSSISSSPPAIKCAS